MYSLYLHIVLFYPHSQVSSTLGPTSSTSTVLTNLKFCAHTPSDLSAQGRYQLKDNVPLKADNSIIMTVLAAHEARSRSGRLLRAAFSPIHDETLFSETGRL